MDRLPRGAVILYLDSVQSCWGVFSNFDERARIWRLYYYTKMQSKQSIRFLPSGHVQNVPKPTRNSGGYDNEMGFFVKR